MHLGLSDHPFSGGGSAAGGWRVGQCCHGAEPLPWPGVLWHSSKADLPPLRLLPEEKALPLQIRVSFPLPAVPG